MPLKDTLAIYLAGPIRNYFLCDRKTLILILLKILPLN